MNVSIQSFIKKNRLAMLASFLIPFLAMILIYLTIGIYPGSARSILASDAFSQSSNFYASFNNVLHGKQSIFYTWNASLGLNYLSLVSYYLGGIFTFLVALFPNQWMPDAIYFITIIKIGCSGLAFWFLAKHTFRIPPWSQVALSVAYALMSFTTAHSELIMWLDAFIYLPLIIWGIHRVMDQKKTVLLFVSYLLMFLSSFYMGFMVAVFSGLYYLARLMTDWKRYWPSLFHYGLTAGLATAASSIIILPAVLDLKTNGESLTTISKLKTEATYFWDLIMKNMIGVYDTTKYGSIPFVYAGLLPLALCLFYFTLKSTPLKNKLAFGSLFAILTASFYLVPLNLFWHGMHAPNMFLFRYAFLFSFLVVFLAGYGWEKINEETVYLLMSIVLVIAAVFCIGFGAAKGHYSYISFTSFLLSIVYLLLYLSSFSLYQLKKLPFKKLCLLLLILMTSEALLNTNGMIRGILSDWNYASRSLYTEPHDDIKQLVNETKKAEQFFYRLENLDPVSSNDSLNFGYSGVSLFSSIRNRNSSSYLDRLGFRSRGTNLNIRYLNNTLMMDSFLGIKYNLSETPLNKFGFSETKKAGDYRLYENQYALPLAFTTTNHIYDLEKMPNDNLGTQTNLINTLSGVNLNYFTFFEPTMLSSDNTKIEDNGSSVTYKEKISNVAKEITWTVAVPADTQAYISLFPTNFNQIESSSATLIVNGESRKTQININGQYYDLGYYAQATTIEFTVSFYGTTEISLLQPKVLALDTKAYQAAMNSIHENGVPMTTTGRTASGEVHMEKAAMLLTTIPYDQGWHAYIDDKEVKITPFEDAFLSIAVPRGKHKVTFKYLPKGFTLGAGLFVVSSLVFIFYVSRLKKKVKQTRKPITRRSRHSN